MFWQLTIDANDPVLLARFWAQALGYQPEPPAQPETTWHAHYRARLGEDPAFDDRLFDPDGLRPPIWFQEVPETKAGKNRLHLDLYPTGRDNALPIGAADRDRRGEGHRAGRAGRQHRAPNPLRRLGGSVLLRRHARPGGKRVLR